MPRGAVGCLDDSHALSPLSSNSPFKPLSHRSATLSSEPPRGILIRRHHPMTQGAVDQQLAAGKLNLNSNNLCLLLWRRRF